MNCEAIKPLLMGLLDNELTDTEKIEVNEHLIRCSTCRDELEQLKMVSNNLSAISYLEPDDNVLRKLWKNPLYRFSQIAGILLIIAGNIFLSGYGIYKLIIDKDTDIFYKTTICAIASGVALLLISVIIQRLKTIKHDPYKEVLR